MRKLNLGWWHIAFQTIIGRKAKATSSGRVVGKEVILKSLDPLNYMGGHKGSYCLRTIGENCLVKEVHGNSGSEQIPRPRHSNSKNQCTSVMFE